MKVILPVHEVCTIPSMNKKEIISFAVIVPVEFHPPVVKNVVSLFQRLFFIRGSTSLIEFFFIFTATRAENPCSQGRLLACDQKFKSLIG